MAKAVGLCLSVLTVLICISYIIALPTFYGIFAFGDHENWDCYASQDRSDTKPYDGDMDNIPDKYHNVTENFRMINLWGFWNFMLPFGIGCLTGIGKCCCCTSSYSDGPAIFAGSMFFFLGLSYISHFATMATMRWRHAGMVCSGDFVPEFNNFWSPLMAGEKPYLH